jgi:Flp pilus assembly pilin Flp
MTAHPIPRVSDARETSVIRKSRPDRGANIPEGKAMFEKLALRIIRNRNDEGASAVEYALLVSLIAVVLIGGVTIFGTALSDFFGGLDDQLQF